MTDWLRSFPPPRLKALARTEGSILEVLHKQYGSLGLAYARGYLTDEEKAELAAMSTADFDALLDRDLAVACPAQAQILQAHRAWYRTQMAALQDALTGRRVATRWR